jgi:hypothetical protein
MSTSVRFVKRGVHGVLRENWQLPGIIKSSKAVVHISAGEVAYGTTTAHPTPPAQDFYYHLGPTSVWVSNVSPHKNDFNPQDPGGVEFLLHVDSDSPLDVAVTITVEDSLPIDIQGY